MCGHASAHRGSEMRLREHVPEALVLLEQVRPVARRPRADPRDLQPGGAGLDRVPHARQDVVPDVAWPAAVVVAEEYQAGHERLRLCLLCAEAAQWPGDEGRAG